MKKMVCQHIMIRVNHSQKRYLLQQMRQLNIVYEDMCKRCIQRQTAGVLMDRTQIYALLKETHKYELLFFEEEDCISMLHQIERALSAQKKSVKRHTYIYNITSSLQWHSLSLQDMSIHKRSIPKGMQFHHASLCMRKGKFYLYLYYQKQ